MTLTKNVFTVLKARDLVDIITRATFLSFSVLKRLLEAMASLVFLKDYGVKFSDEYFSQQIIIISVLFILLL